MDINEIQEQKQFESLIQGLMDSDYGYCNDFITTSTVEGLRANISRLKGLGSMRTSGLGDKNSYLQNLEIRSDKINWLESNSINPFELLYINKIQRFVNYLNRTCFTSIKSFESHYASYEKDAFYKKHIDQFKNEKDRKYSIVLYLNHDWKEEDGGVLSLYPKEGIQVNISPSGGRLVFFRSDEMLHEVQASLTRDRNSVVAWLKIK